MNTHSGRSERRVFNTLHGNARRSRDALQQPAAGTAPRPGSRDPPRVVLPGGKPPKREAPGPRSLGLRRCQPVSPGGIWASSQGAAPETASFPGSCLPYCAQAATDSP